MADRGTWGCIVAIEIRRCRRHRAHPRTRFPLTDRHRGENRRETTDSRNKRDVTRETRTLPSRRVIVAHCRRFVTPEYPPSYEPLCRSSEVRTEERDVDADNTRRSLFLSLTNARRMDACVRPTSFRSVD